jgi:hypothetical protein
MLIVAVSPGAVFGTENDVAPDELRLELFDPDAGFPTNTAVYPLQVVVPELRNDQLFVKASPGLTDVPSG